MQFLRRFFRHVAMTPWTAWKCFSESTLDEIQKVVGEEERRHRGEVRFVVEAELTTAQLWAGLTSRQRAIEVFANLHVWNTEENTGILLYVLLADHRVEIIADRGIQKRVAEEQWQAICREMEAHFRESRFREGAIAGVRAASELLAKHFPADASNANELPNQPVML